MRWLNRQLFPCHFQQVERIFQMLAAFVLMLFFFGCAAFKSSHRMDLTPFAESMIAVAGDIQYSLEKEEIIYTRDLIVGPEVDHVRIMEDKVRAILRGAIAYSLEIVTLAQSNLSGSERAEFLADYLDGVLRPVLREPRPELNLTIAELDTILDDVRAQDELFEALNAAQPVITEVARAAGEIIEGTKDAVDKAGSVIEQKIVAENRGLIKMKRELRSAQVNSMMNLSLLGDYRRGSKAALDSLLEREPSLKEVIRSTDRVMIQEIRAIEERMLFKLNALHQLREQLKPDLELYWNKQQELQRLLAVYHANLRKARIAFIVWAQAHERLAAGITDPAKIDVLGLAAAAGGMVKPF